MSDEPRGIRVVFVDKRDPVWVTHYQFDVKWPSAMRQQAVVDRIAEQRGQRRARRYPCRGSLRVREPAARYPTVQCDECGFEVALHPSHLREDLGPEEPAGPVQESLAGNETEG